MEQTRPPDPPPNWCWQLRNSPEWSKKQAHKSTFDNQRTTQVYNPPKATKVEVIDRFQLILKFYPKSHNNEAQLQIQLAMVRHD
jgi:50S ribosomal subunit-associated GTPase HflX